MEELGKSTHLVLKRSDIDEHLSEVQKEALVDICNTIRQGRIYTGKTMNSYYVCNIDEPYAPAVIKAILKGEAAKEKAVTFDIGDRVRVRAWDDLVKEFPMDSEGDLGIVPHRFHDFSVYFTQDMKPLCGQTATICGVNELFGAVAFELNSWSCPEPENGYIFPPAVLEKVEE